MSIVFIGSTGDSSGQSLMAWALGQRLMEKGLTVGFFKPFGTHPVYIDGKCADQDAVLFKEIFKLAEPLEKISPFAVSEEEWKLKGKDEIQKEIKTLSEELSADKDVLIILGSQHIFFDNPMLPVPDISLINELDAECILLHRFQKSSTSIYSILSLSSLLRDRLKAIVFNRIPFESLQDVRANLIPSFEKKGITITGALAEDPFLSFVTLKEVIDCLDGEILCGDECLGNPIGGMTVGSGDLTGSLMLFKRAYNKIVLLEPCPPGHESEPAVARRSVAGILLTGGRSPAPQIIDVARKCSVPLVLVKPDTFTSLERIEKIVPALSPEDHSKVLRFLELMDSDCSMDRLIGILNP